VDDSVWMAGVGSSVLGRAVIILLVVGVSTVVVFVCLLMLQVPVAAAAVGDQRRFHRCAACRARNSSVALWGWLQGRSPCWRLCAECAFGVQDFDEVPRSRRHPGVQIARRQPGAHIASNPLLVTAQARRFLRVVHAPQSALLR
jgi:hypothetical protein